MKAEQFLERLKDCLNLSGVLSLDCELKGLEGWDSMGQVCVIAMLDEIGCAVDAESLAKCKTPNELAELAGIGLEL